jgi:hypothetical protein
MNELTKINANEDFELAQRIAKVFYVSNMFPDLKSHAQAIVKVLVGKEVGLPPYASINGIHMVMGKPTLGSNLIATLIAGHPNYNYRIRQLDSQICEIEFYDSPTKAVNSDTAIGTVTFTIQEAETAGLLAKKDSIWLKYPSDMLFARAISRGARRYTPGIFGGATVYTPDEMGVDIDEDGVIEVRSEGLKKFADSVTDHIGEGLKKVDIQHMEPSPRVEPKPVPFPECKQVYTYREPDLIINASMPTPGSDEAIIEEIKETHVISEEFR